MELSHLRYFREVARTENITKAARDLYITQPALSVTMKRLEEELGFTLFVRDKNKIKLTEAGECFLTYVNSMFTMLEEGQQKARNIASQKDHELRVASGFGILREMYSDYLELYPEAKAEIRCIPTDKIIDSLANGRADIGLVLGEIDDNRFESRVIMTGCFYVCVNTEHVLARYADTGVTMKQLEGQLLFCSNIAKTHEKASSMFKKAGVTVNLLTLDERDVLFSAADKGLGGVFCMPMKDMRSTMESTRELRVVWIPILDCPDVGKVVLLSPKGTYYGEEQERFIRYIEHRFEKNEAGIRKEFLLRGIPLPKELQVKSTI